MVFVQDYGVEIRATRHSEYEWIGKKSSYRAESSSISSSSIVRDGQHYIKLPTGARYEIILSNFHDTPAIAKIEVDGKTIGRWHVPARDKLVIKRPSDVDRELIFEKSSSQRASRAGVVHGNPDNGLVRVTFVPYRYRPQPVFSARGLYREANKLEPELEMEEAEYESRFVSASPLAKQSAYPLGQSARKSAQKLSAAPASSLSRLRSGATLLGDRPTGQTFTQIAEPELDYSREVVITLRLVIEDEYEDEPYRRRELLDFVDRLEPHELEQLWDHLQWRLLPRFGTRYPSPVE